MSQGYVYILSNPSMPGIVKIGRSKNGGRSRANDLYRASTGVPSPFKMEFEVWCEDCISVETDAHFMANGSRISEEREFFSLEIGDAIKIVLNAVGQEFNLVVSNKELVVSEFDIHWLGRQLEMTGRQNTPLPLIAESLQAIDPEFLAAWIIYWNKRKKPSLRKALDQFAEEIAVEAEA